MRWWPRVRRAAHTLYAGGWVANLVVGLLLLLITPSLNAFIMQSYTLSLLLAGIGVLWLLGFVLFRAWRDEPTRGETPLQLTVEILGGAVMLVGSGVHGGTPYALWHLWLELYLVPVAGSPASLAQHRITGNLAIAGLNAARFEELVLATHYETPPDCLRLLDSARQSPRHVTVASPLPLLLVASCHTPPWDPTLPTPPDEHLHVLLEITERDYAPLDVVAPLQHLPGTTTWQVP